MPERKKELIGLIKKYRLGKASPEEVIFLEKYYQYFDKEEKISQHFSENDKIELEKKMFSVIQSGIYETPVIPIYKRVWFRIAAAAIFIIMAGSIYFILTNGAKTETATTDPQKKISNDVAAPTNAKATITLADGSIVTLDSASKGMLATQDNVNIVKTADGKIVYSRESSKVNGELVYNTLSNPRGSLVVDMTLADGSRVWLNAGSSVTYPVAFTGNERKVSITGEAYFEVATLRLRSGQKMPFKVKINESTEVEVLGTHFNINAYSDEASITTTLLEGSVRVTANKKVQLLSPGQQAQVNANAINLITDADVAQAVAWKDGLFAFTDADLPTVMRQLARWYDIEVKYEGVIPEREFNGKIGKTLTLNQVLRVLTKSHVNYRIENGNKITIIP